MPAPGVVKGVERGMWAHLAALSCGLLGTAWHCLVCLARPGFPTNSASTLPKRPLAQAVARVSCLGRQVCEVVTSALCCEGGLLCKVCAFADLLFSKAECNCSFFFFCPSSVSTMPAALSAGRLPIRSLPFAHPCHHGLDH